MINVLDSRTAYIFELSTPEQGGKFKTPVAHAHLIKVESPPGARCEIGL